MPDDQKIIDSNVYLSRWPFRRLPADEPQALVGKLRRGGVTQAWVGSFDAMLHRDLGAVNARLANECRQYGNGMLLPFGTVNPMLPDWREELRRCHEDHRMMGLRLLPAWHGYKIDSNESAELMALATARRMLIQIVTLSEDERTQHPLVRTSAVDIRKAPALFRSISDLRIQFLNIRTPLTSLITEIAQSGNAAFDFAMVEGVHGLKRLIELAGPDKVVFGSYMPFYYFESARLKVKEAQADAAAVLTNNAKRLLGDPR